MEGEGEKRYCGRVPLRAATMLFDPCRVRQRVLRHVGIAGVYGFFFRLSEKSGKLELLEANVEHRMCVDYRLKAGAKLEVER